ncbi:MAG TPA: rhamnogalacturonan lyase, partial [Polyangiaceae bacterium]|nr:rhamnogalacturonan lyase [Polyangiaceae bacterium]
ANRSGGADGQGGSAKGSGSSAAPGTSANGGSGSVTSSNGGDAAGGAPSSSKNGEGGSNQVGKGGNAVQGGANSTKPPSTKGGNGGAASRATGVGGKATGGAAIGGAATGGSGKGGSASGGSGEVGPSSCGVNPGLATGKVQMENLCRGLVAVRSGSNNFLSWRLMGYEPMDTGFNVYRNGTKVTSSPITNSTNYVDEGAPATATYTVRAVLDGTEQGDSSNTRASKDPTSTLGQNYFTIALKTPAEYAAGDTSPGDLDGDGQYELVVKEQKSPMDPSQDGVTGQPKFAAYRLDGTFLWRVDLGLNIRESEHTTPFIVYDMDGDGSAELVVKTAPGTKDGTGAFLKNGPAADDDDSKDCRNSAGRILGGCPEYLTVFRGRDGAELATIKYHATYDSGAWGDTYGNRSDRYNASVAFLDATGRPSAVMQRGYYARTTFGAYNYRDGKLSLVWTFDSAASGNSAYGGKGTHSMMVADTDGDNRQEIIPGSITISPDGKGMCTTTGGGHGDALHIGDFDLSRPGLEVFQPTEESGAPAYIMRDAKTCEIIFKGPNSTEEGPGRGAADDISPNNPGGEAWVNSAGLFGAATGKSVGSNPSSCNFLIWWDGDESRELLNGNSVSEYDGAGQGFTATGCSSINGTKSVPNLSADLIGDWREEVVFLCGNSLRVYTTTQVTKRRIYTLMHDPQYRANVSAQNATYNQPPHTSFHIGDGMKEPPAPSINVK